MAKKNDSLLLRCNSRVGNDCKQITKQRIRNRRAAKCTTRSLELLKFCKSKLFETDEALQKILAELND